MGITCALQQRQPIIMLAADTSSITSAWLHVRKHQAVDSDAFTAHKIGSEASNFKLPKAVKGNVFFFLISHAKCNMM